MIGLEGNGSCSRRSWWDGSFKAFLDDLRTNPKFYYDTSEDLFETVLATSKRIDPELVKLFKVLPSMPMDLAYSNGKCSNTTTITNVQLPMVLVQVITL